MSLMKGPAIKPTAIESSNERYTIMLGFKDIS